MLFKIMLLNASFNVCLLIIIIELEKCLIKFFFLFLWKKRLRFMYSHTVLIKVCLPKIYITPFTKEMSRSTKSNPCFCCFSQYVTFVIKISFAISVPHQRFCHAWIENWYQFFFIVANLIGHCGFVQIINISLFLKSTINYITTRMCILRSAV